MARRSEVRRKSRRRDGEAPDGPCCVECGVPIDTSDRGRGGRWPERCPEHRKAHRARREAERRRKAKAARGAGAQACDASAAGHGDEAGRGPGLPVNGLPVNGNESLRKDENHSISSQIHVMEVEDGSRLEAVPEVAHGAGVAAPCGEDEAGSSQRAGRRGSRCCECGVEITPPARGPCPERCPEHAAARRREQRRERMARVSRERAAAPRVGQCKVCAVEVPTTAARGRLPTLCETHRREKERLRSRARRRSGRKTVRNTSVARTTRAGAGKSTRTAADFLSGVSAKGGRLRQRRIRLERAAEDALRRTHGSVAADGGRAPGVKRPAERVNQRSRIPSSAPIFESEYTMRTQAIEEMWAGLMHMRDRVRPAQVRCEAEYLADITILAGSMLMAYSIDGRIQVTRP